MKHKQSINVELEVDEQHGRLVRVTIGDTSVAVYVDGWPAAVVTTPKGQYGIPIDMRFGLASSDTTSANPPAAERMRDSLGDD